MLAPQTSGEVVKAIVKTGGSTKVKVCTLVHPAPPSAIVTVYVPAQRPVAAAEFPVDAFALHV